MFCVIRRGTKSKSGVLTTDIKLPEKFGFENTADFGYAYALKQFNIDTPKIERRYDGLWIDDKIYEELDKKLAEMSRDMGRMKECISETKKLTEEFNSLLPRAREDKRMFAILGMKISGLCFIFIGLSYHLTYSIPKEISYMFPEWSSEKRSQLFFELLIPPETYSLEIARELSAGKDPRDVAKKYPFLGIFSNKKTIIGELPKTKTADFTRFNLSPGEMERIKEMKECLDFCQWFKEAKNYFMYTTNQFIRQNFTRGEFGEYLEELKMEENFDISLSGSNCDAKV